MNLHRLGRLTAVVGVAAVLAGCGEPAPPAGSLPIAPTAPAAPATPRLPPRPVELPLGGVDPCALLGGGEQRSLGVRKSSQLADSDGLGSPGCLWSNFGGTPDNAWLVRLITKRGADYGLDSDAGARVVSVDGFPTVQTWAGGVDPKTHCILLVDVAPGQSMWAQYDNLAGDHPGISPEKSCQLAAQAAELMVRNLRGLSSR